MKFAAWHSVWQQRTSGERRLLALAAIVLALALLWQWGLASPLATWRMAPQKQAEIDQQSRQMLQLQAEALGLKNPPRIERSDAVAWLETSASSLLGQDARLVVQGDQVRLKLVAAPAAGLSQWLAQAREKAQAMPLGAQLQQVPSPPSASSERDTTTVVWRGELTLRLAQ